MNDHDPDHVPGHAEGHDPQHVTGHDHDRDQPPVRPARGSRLRRSAFYAASTGVLLWAATIVPLPLVEYLPNEPTSIPPMIEIDGAEVTELKGDTALLTILLRQQPMLQSLTAWFDDQRELRPAAEVYRSGTDREEHLRAERRRFVHQFDIAAGVGARAAGIEADIETEVRVAAVVPGSPADGLLDPHDLVLEVNGTPVESAENLQEATAAGQLGGTVILTIERAGDRLDVEVPLADLDDTGTPRMGVEVRTHVTELRLPVDVRLTDEPRIGGPSAGLMVALTVYDLLSDEDLLAGRTVMGTGAIDVGGYVHGVGGVPEKMVAAAEHGADLVLVPQSQLGQARRAATPELDIVGVRTFDEALEALRAIPAPTPS